MSYIQPREVYDYILKVFSYPLSFRVIKEKKINQTKLKIFAISMKEIMVTRHFAGENLILFNNKKITTYLLESIYFIFYIFYYCKNVISKCTIKSIFVKFFYVSN